MDIPTIIKINSTSLVSSLPDSLSSNGPNFIPKIGSRLVSFDEVIKEKWSKKFRLTYIIVYSPCILKTILSYDFKINIKMYL